MESTKELFFGKNLSDFEKKLFYKRQVQDLKKELSEKDFKIGEMQSEIDELKYEIENNKYKSQLYEHQQANAKKKQKIRELKIDLNRYIKCYGRIS